MLSEEEKDTVIRQYMLLKYYEYLRFDCVLNNYGIMLGSELWESIFTEINLSTYSQCCSTETYMNFKTDRQRFRSILTLPALEKLPFFRSIRNVISSWNELKFWVMMGIKLFYSEWGQFTDGDGYRSSLLLGKLKAGGGGLGVVIVSVSIQGRKF